MANDLSFNQLSTILNSILVQANGTSNIVVTDTSSFITGGQEALKAGYDTLSTAISQVLSKTIFSVRPYTSKFKGLEMSVQQYGNMMRKLSVIDKAFEDDVSIDPTVIVDTGSVDPFVINKPLVQQENFYGREVYKKMLTIYDWQLDQAFSGPDQFASFIGMMMQNASDMLEQARENTKRMTLVNLIGAILGNYSTNQNIQLVTEYNAYIGASPSLTWADICGDNSHYQRFMRFAYGRIATVASLFTERSAKFHVSLSGKTIMRHTPYADQRLYMLGQERYSMEAQVLADAFHDNYLTYADVETVNFWQAINSPDEINITPSYLETTGGNAGTIQKGAAVNATGIFAVLMDRDACGVVQMNERARTAYNPRGEYTNYFWSVCQQYYNSFTENAVVFTLD
ncbi:MAG: hypothetical protein IKY65_04430 [Rikenellaceae bacterium]|nr:hypothetical protein [Rikenellaceae bacterium]